MDLAQIDDNSTTLTWHWRLKTEEAWVVTKESTKKAKVMTLPKDKVGLEKLYTMVET